MSTIFDLVHRIKYLRQKHSLSQAAFAKMVGVSQGNVGDWERHRSSPSLHAIEAIVKQFNVSADWLLFGKETSLPPVEDENQDHIVNLIKELCEEDKKEIQTIVEYLQFRRRKEEEQSKHPPRSRKEKNSHGKEATEEAAKEAEEGYLPLLGSSTDGRPVLVNEVLQGYVLVDRQFVKDKTFIIRAKGDSMAGADIDDGDLVIVRHQTTVAQGEAALVRIGGEFTIKYFHQQGDRIVLTSANPKYKPIEVSVDHDFAIIGKVIHVIKKEDGEAKLRDFYHE